MSSGVSFFCFMAWVFSVKFGSMVTCGKWHGSKFEKISQDSEHQGELNYQRNLGILRSLKDQFEDGDHEFMILIYFAQQLSLVVHCCTDKYRQGRYMVEYIQSWGSAKRNVIKGRVHEFKVLANKKWYVNCIKNKERTVSMKWT